MNFQQLRIIQEAVSNVLKHAQAGTVMVRLTQEDNEIVLQIIDDGVGICGADMDKPHSFGLRGMRERASSLGGSVEIHARQPRGTELLLRVPPGAAAVTSFDD